MQTTACNVILRLTSWCYSFGELIPFKCLRLYLRVLLTRIYSRYHYVWLCTCIYMTGHTSSSQILFLFGRFLLWFGSGVLSNQTRYKTETVEQYDLLLQGFCSGWKICKHKVWYTRWNLAEYDRSGEYLLCAVLLIC